MFQYDFDQSLIYWVCTTAHAFERALNEELAPHGITYRQWQVLGWLVLEGVLSQGELADRMRIEASTLAGIVERMERDGWIVRESCSEDRRKKLIHLTDKAEPLWSTIAEAARRVRTQAAEGLSEPERQQLLAWLELMQDNLQGVLSREETSK